MVCSKMKDKIWQKAQDKKHFYRRRNLLIHERTLMGHAHIVWVLLAAARIAVRALNRLFPRPIWHSGYMQRSERRHRGGDQLICWGSLQSFRLEKSYSFIHSFILWSGLSYTLPCLRPGPINQSSNPNAKIAVTMEGPQWKAKAHKPYNYGHL